MSAKNCFIITIVCIVLYVIFVLIELYLLSLISIIVAFVFLVAAIYKYNVEQVYKEYAEFSDMSEFFIGMSKEDVRMLNSKYIETRIDETNEALSNICETCGGKVVNGVCTYCGNKYDDSSKVTYLVYDTRYGERTFTFKGNVLTNTRIWVKPMENFL